MGCWPPRSSTSPGSSAVFRGGLVVYATDLKHAWRAYPTVCWPTAGRSTRTWRSPLAAGARERCGADWGLATTGVAGPEPQDGKPVGLVYVAVAGPAGAGRARELDLDGDRAAVRTGRGRRRVLSLLADAAAATGARLPGGGAGLPGHACRVTAGGQRMSGRAEVPHFGGAGCRRGPQRVRLREASGGCRRPRREGEVRMVLLRRVIGDALRARRQGQHRTLREVSTAANVSLGYLSEIERGQKEASSELLAADLRRPRRPPVRGAARGQRHPGPGRADGRLVLDPGRGDEATVPAGPSARRRSPSRRPGPVRPEARPAAPPQVRQVATDGNVSVSVRQDSPLKATLRTTRKRTATSSTPPDPRRPLSVASP